MPASELAGIVRANRTAILSVWEKRTRPWRSDDADGASLLDWLGRALETGRVDDVPAARGCARTIADLVALRDALLSTWTDGRAAERDRCVELIDAAIGRLVSRERAERATLRGRVEFAAAATHIGAWEIDPTTGIVTIDDRGRDLFGLRSDVVTGVDGLLARIDEEDRSCIERALRAARDAGEAGLVECRVAREDAGAVRWLVVAMHRLDDPSGPRLIGVVYDITDRKRVEEEHSRVVEELSRAVHVSEMFIGILSHDLRNPLAAIVTGATLLQQTTRDSDEGGQSGRVLARIVSSSQRMERMIDQLLDFTRARLGEGIPLHLERVDAANIAREVVEELATAAPGWTFDVKTEGETVGIWDHDRLAQVLSNLVGNALQHGERGGGARVVVDGAEAPAVAIRVTNRGTIPKDVLPVLFNPFRGTLQKRDKSKGLGLGLYVARQIALAHGGDIEVDSSPEHGTTFSVRLPRTAEPSPVSRRREMAEEELAAIESLAVPSQSTAVTAQLFGAVPLHERAPIEYSEIVERYGRLLDLALRRQAYRGEVEGFSDELRALAARLGALGAGAREATEVHARALRSAVRGAPAAKAHTLVAEGRLLALELMGNLVSFYRRRAGGTLPPATEQKGKIP